MQGLGPNCQIQMLKFDAVDAEIGPTVDCDLDPMLMWCVWVTTDRVVSMIPAYVGFAGQKCTNRSSGCQS